MEKITFRQDTILNGQSPTWIPSGDERQNATQYNSAYNIDPDVSINLSSGRTIASGVIQPIMYSKFSSTAVDSTPMWLVTPQKGTELLYSYLANGSLISHNTGLASETDIGTPTSGAGNGAAYYNNYIYLATPTDVSRYGPLDGTPAIANNFWVTTLSMTASVNTTYPNASTITYPNHSMHAHTDGALYWCDFDSTSTTDTTRGKGLIHKIKTKYGSSGTNHQGAVNDGSAYNVLDLPLDYMPTDIESYGTDLVIAAVRTTTTTFNRGKAALFFWDTISPSFYRQVDIPWTAATALLNKNGELYAFAGNFSSASVVLKYTGGYSFDTVQSVEGDIPPMAGAVDSYGNRIVYGTTAVWPDTFGVVRSVGYKSNNLPSNALHTIAKISQSGADQVVASLAYSQQASGAIPRLVIGWRQSSNFGIDSFASSSVTAQMNTQNFYVGKRFNIRKITIPFSNPVNASTNIVPIIRFDNGTGVKTLPTINNTNYPSQTVVVYHGSDIENAVTAAYIGQTNFYIEFSWSSSDALAILPGIEIEVETYDD